MLMGNLTADVTTRSTQNGNNIANFTVASNRSYQKDGQWVDVPSFVAVAASGKLAEFIASKFHKGDPIMVAGTLSSYSYKNKDGENRTSYTVWADKAAFASRGKDTAQNSTPAPAATPASAPAPSAPTYGEYGADEFDAVEEEDDLPF
jgi:single-strand DNA-binding protein